jgi:hypothetical protein
LETAIRRFFKAIEGKFDTQGFDEQWLRECIEESDCWQEKCEVYNRETGKTNMYLVVITGQLSQRLKVAGMLS